jgi:hypothetical protein
MIEASFEFDKADLAEMQRQMERRMQLLKRTPNEATRDAVVQILRAIGSSTRRGKKKRPVVKNPDPRTGKDGRVGLWAIVSYRRGQVRHLPVRGRLRENAMSDPRRIIKRSGLAKSSWGWMFKSLDMSLSVMTEYPEISGATQVTKRNLPGDSEVKLENKMRYILHALQSRGRGDIQTAMRRGANMLRKKTERQLEALKRIDPTGRTGKTDWVK